MDSQGKFPDRLESTLTKVRDRQSLIFKNPQRFVSFVFRRACIHIKDNEKDHYIKHTILQTELRGVQPLPAPDDQQFFGF